jgi:hypothetical protein
MSNTETVLFIAVILIIPAILFIPPIDNLFIAAIIAAFGLVGWLCVP